jgi:HK97 gp10 family phage protein
MATRIQGVDRLKRKLRRFPDAAREEIAKAMEQSANEIVALMKSLVPVDTGDAQMSISWTWGDAPKGSMVLGKVRQGGKGAGNLVITIFAGGGEAFYARFLEFGTKNMPAHPFFYPAWRALRRRVRGRTTRAINKSAKRIAAGG